MRKKEPHSIICAEDVFKSNVKLKSDVLILDPSVSPSFIREMGKIIEEDYDGYLF